MKILIVSDTHGRLDHLEEAMERVVDFDALIHCGDFEGQDEEIRDMADGVPVTLVRGNNDWDSRLPYVETVELDGVRILVTHGHRFGAYNTSELVDRAREEGCRVACYGHTHFPVIDEDNDGVDILNPGSLTFPRQPNRRPSYIVMEITPRGQLLYTINYLGSEPRKKRSWFW
ncbi:MAG: metallophosphoesterase [Lachnospiraceae bacterium]|nr:metallophosphoesterase [Lachnospiraceae bacterium]